MSIGEKFATKNEVEVLRRKLQLALNGATIVQIEAEEIGVTNFTDLADVPSSYAATGNFAVRVNSTVDALEFAELKGTTNQVTVTANAADYTLSLPQDIHTGASPTFVTAKLSALTDGYVPYHVSDAVGLANSPVFTDGISIVTIRNLTDAVVDPIYQVAVGATPVVKWTWGLDDSDADKWKLANNTALGTGPTGDLFFGDILYYTHEANNGIVGVELEDFVTDDIYIVGGFGSGDGQFDHGRQIAYDGMYLYAVDGQNDRVQKFLAASGTFVSHTIDNLSLPWGCAYWNGFIYVSCGTGAYTGTIRKFDAATMLFQSAFGSNGTGDNNFSVPRSLTTDGTWLYICDTGNYRVKKHTLAGVYVDQVGSSGTDDGEFGISMSGIATNGTYLYVGDYGNHRVQIFNCSDLSFVAKVNMPNRTGSPGSPASITLNGTHWYVGVNDGAPFAGYHIKYDIATNTFQAYYDCSVAAGNDPLSIYGSIIFKEYTDKVIHGDLIVVHVDGSFIDIYPKARFLDSIRLYESADLAGEYVGIEAPTDVTLSYNLVLPPTVNTVKTHLYADVGGILDWGQNVDSDGSPEFGGVTLTAFSGILVATAGVVSDDAELADLADVTFPSGEPDIGDVLTYESGGWTSMPPAGGAAAFLDLTDVTEVDYAGHAAEFVVVNGAENGLEFSASSVAGHDILSVNHTDVNTAAPDDQDVLTWDAGAGEWLAQKLPAAGPHDLESHTDVFFLSGEPIVGDVLTYESGGWTAVPPINITISDSAASGGSNGDIWLEY
jgi:hypothetical protein